MKTKRIEELEDYASLIRLAEAVWRHDEEGRGAAVMVGAGFSRCAERPSPDSKLPPLWSDLRWKMATALYPDGADRAPQDALRLAEEYRTLFGAAQMNSFIRAEVPDALWQPGDAHLQLLKLPWVEVLTTNWDTLLERAARKVGARHYQLVRNKSDLAQARSPRIVKLHGTIGYDESYIFTEDDYREFPVRHAAFVNLARQVLLENDLCMVGFSGVDPNFLQWSGWVRDQLGQGSRRMYLVGVLGLSRAGHKLLSDRNIVPIDLEPLVSHLPRSKQHQEALNHWVRFLEAAKPQASYDWQLFREPAKHYTPAELDRHLLDPTTIAKDLREEVLPHWTAERESYPGWLVCPSVLREKIRLGMYSTLNRLTRARPALMQAEWNSLLYETAWRFDIAWIEPTQELLGWMSEAVTAKSGDEDQRHHMLCMLLRHARESGDGDGFEQWSGVLEAECDDNSDRLAECVYQTCLLLRDTCKFAELENALEGLKGRDPAYGLRKAALFFELTRTAEGHRCLVEALDNLRGRELDNRRSIWIRSRRAWAQWLVFLSPHEPVNGVSAFESDFHTEQVSRCNPWAELKAVYEKVQAARQERNENAARRFEATFEVGRFRDRRKEPEFANQLEVSSTVYASRRLPEVVGICSGVDSRHPFSFVLDGNCLLSCSDATWMARLLASAAHARRSPLDEHLGRVAVALLPQLEASTAIARFFTLAEYWLTRLRTDGVDTHRRVGDALGWTLTGLVRLTPRMSPKEAERAFELGLRILTVENLQRSKTFSVLQKLFEHSVAAISPNRRPDMALAAIRSPLSTEGKDSSSSDRDTWPNPVVSLLEDAGRPRRDQDEAAWRARIADLISAAQTRPSRREAVTRLAFLSRQGLLAEAEAEAFGVALWSLVDTGENPLPLHVNLYPSAFAGLPAPRDVDVRDRVRLRVFDLAQDMDEHEVAAAMVVASAVNPPILPSAASAIVLFDKLVAAIPAMKEPDGPFAGWGKPSLAGRRQVAADALASAVVPALAREDGAEARLEAVLGLIALEGCSVLLECLPWLLMGAPGRLDEVAQRVEDALSSSSWDEVRAGCKAINVWLEATSPEFGSAAPRLVQALLYALESGNGIKAAFLLPCIAQLLDRPDVLPTGAVPRIGRAVLRIGRNSSYEKVATFSIEAALVSQVRVECCTICHKLLAVLDGPTRDDLEEWLSEARSDPLPEVRDAALQAEV